MRCSAARAPAAREGASHEVDTACAKPSLLAPRVPHDRLRLHGSPPTSRHTTGKLTRIALGQHRNLRSVESLRACRPPSPDIHSLHCAVFGPSTTATFARVARRSDKECAPHCFMLIAPRPGSTPIAPYAPFIGPSAPERQPARPSAIGAKLERPRTGHAARERFEQVCPHEPDDSGCRHPVAAPDVAGRHDVTRQPPDRACGRPKLKYRIQRAVPTLPQGNDRAVGWSPVSTPAAPATAFLKYNCKTIGGFHAECQ